jgi:hypothetical protein
VAALLVVAGVIVWVQFGRLGGSPPTGFPPDAPPEGVAVFYVRETGNPHGLIAYDWSGARRGSVRLPTWVEISRLRPAPNGSGFLLDPSTPGDYAAYFDRGGRTLFETNDSGFLSQAWADDSVHVCVLSDSGNGTELVTRLPGKGDRAVLTRLSGVYVVAGCSVRNDVIVLAGSSGIEVLRLSSGRVLATMPAAGPVLASTDASYIAVSTEGAGPVPVYKTSDLFGPVAQLDVGLQPLAFSGDDSLILASQPGGEVKAIALRDVRVAWTYNASAASVDLVVARPSNADFVLYLSTGPVLLRRDGKTGTFG